MTLSEIERAVHDVIQSHPTLDETGLLYMLESAGWDKRSQEDARQTFRHMDRSAVASQVEVTQREEVRPSLHEEQSIVIKEDDSQALVAYEENTVPAVRVPPPPPPHDLPILADKGHHTFSEHLRLHAEEDRNKETKKVIYSDTGLVATAITLFIVLLCVLGYMYREGRL